MRKITRKNLESFLEKHATEEEVLDIGAGRVDTNHSYDKFFPLRHTVDIDSAREPDTVGDIHNLPFDNDSHGTILCTEVLEHCHTPQKAIDEMYRVLKPGGLLILTTRFVYPLHDTPHDYFRFTKYGLGHLLRDWQDVKIVPETETFSAIGALMQRVGFQTILRGGKFSKAVVYSTAFILDKMNGLIKSEYGNIQRTSPDDHIMATGYYLTATKVR